jgi:tetratricopeptide (TPR) repeat protein
VVAIKSRDSIYDLYDWVEHLRRTLPIDVAIRTVSDSLEKVDGEDHRILASELAQLLREAGRDSEALQVLDQMMQRYPDDVRPAISKAVSYLYFLEDPEEALKSIDLALQRANRTGFFRREALGNKARILLKLGRGDELSDVLEEIMSLQIVEGIPDIGRERDFVDRAPPGLIRKGVLDRYNEFRPKRPGDTSANEPPEYEPPDDAA